MASRFPRMHRITVGFWIWNAVRRKRRLGKKMSAEFGSGGKHKGNLELRGSHGYGNSQTKLSRFAILSWRPWSSSRFHRPYILAIAALLVPMVGSCWVYPAHRVVPSLSTRFTPPRPYISSIRVFCSADPGLVLTNLSLWLYFGVL